MGSGQREIRVAVPIPKFDTLLYKVPEGYLLPPPGTRVVVPVGTRRLMIGIVWDDDLSKEEEPFSGELKGIREILDDSPILHRAYREFITRVSRYYVYPLGLVLEEALPSIIFSARTSSIEEILEGKKRRSFALPPLIGGVSVGEVAHLTEWQDRVLEEVEGMLSSNSFSPALLLGVTGSGKTEIYLRAAKAALKQGKEVLVLVPEIALASQLIASFKAVLGESVGIWHSKITGPQKMTTWEAIEAGTIRVIVGVRSSIFTPLKNIGLIVVDEEHDPSYKQESKLRYNARDLALLLGKLHKATVLLGSATPSVTTFKRAERGDYRLLELPERVFSTPLPQVDIVDMKGKRSKGQSGFPWWMSDLLLKSMKETLDRGDQCLLFLNRRGFAPFCFCRDCGHVHRCPHCDISLTLHKSWGKGEEGVLVCHVCGYATKALLLCPNCNGSAIGTRGLGTEQVLEEIQRLFPDIRAERFDRDTLSSKRRYVSILEGFHRGEIHVIVGTQMITKGFDFPNLGLVGVIWGDQSLHFPSFNASERTFQLLTQVAGRAGRRDRQGRVIVQTFQPSHYAIRFAASHDYHSFAKEESQRRHEHGYPPYGHLINLIFSGRDRERVKNFAINCANIAKGLEVELKRRYTVGMEVLGPSPGIRPKVKDTFVWNLLLKGASRGIVRTCLSMLLSKIQNKSRSGVRIEIDCDPIGLA